MELLKSDAQCQRLIFWIQGTFLLDRARPAAVVVDSLMESQISFPNLQVEIHWHFGALKLQYSN